MDSTSINLVGSKITAVEVSGNDVKVRFEPAYLIKMMTGSVERTRWWQNGYLVFKNAELEGELPTLPAECIGGDVGESVYTYRDMVPVPMMGAGPAHCVLKLQDKEASIRVQGATVDLELEDVPKYIEHIRPES